MNDRGTFRKYVDKRFRADAIEAIGKINAVIEEYSRQGFTLTVRQIYYQFVSRGWIENEPRKYDSLQALISEGRLAGLVSWTAIEDRGRNLRGLQTWRHPNEVLRNARASYRRDLWATQPWRPEVWVEKAALEGVVGQICNRLRVDFFACRGYNSQSEQWRAGRRFANYVQKGQRPVVFHLGDHDPSGIDMTRDNRERLEMFAGTPVLVQRLALNMPQIEQYRPPPNPAKVSDPRARDYVTQFGRESWELDALDPRVIQDLIDVAVRQLRDPALWDSALAAEVDDLRLLDDMIDMAGGGYSGVADDE